MLSKSLLNKKLAKLAGLKNNYCIKLHDIGDYCHKSNTICRYKSVDRSPRCLAFKETFIPEYTEGIKHSTNLALDLKIRMQITVEHVGIVIVDWICEDRYGRVEVKRQDFSNFHDAESYARALAIYESQNQSTTDGEKGISDEMLGNNDSWVS